MGSGRRLRCAVSLAAAAIAAPLPAVAQGPASPEAAAIRDCLCLHRSLDASTVEMNGKIQQLERARAEFARLDADLKRARQAEDVNDPASIGHVKLLLQQRDAAFKRANGPLVDEVRAAIARNASQVSEYNSRCAGHPFDQQLTAQIQATLVCPPSQ